MFSKLSTSKRIVAGFAAAAAFSLSLTIAPAYAADGGNTGGTGSSVLVPTLVSECGVEGQVILPGTAYSATTSVDSHDFFYNAVRSGNTVTVTSYYALSEWLTELEDGSWAMVPPADLNVADLYPTSLDDPDSGVWTFDVTATECDFGNIDFSARGSLTIHKYADDGTTSENTTGHELSGSDLPGGQALEGVEFTVTPVTGIDLSDPDAWDGLADLTVAQALGEGTGTPLVKVTNAAGVADFSDLPVGVYVVEETDKGDNPIVSSVAPFIVTIPRADSGSWLYDIHVYPKNSLAEVDKEAIDAGAAGIGSQMAWTVAATIPQGSDDLTAFVFEDSLDSRLTYVNGSAVVKVGSTTIPATASVSGNQLSVAVSNPAELEALRGQDAVLSFKTTVTSLGATGVIENVADVYYNDPSNKIDSDLVKTQWGAVEILKHVAGDEGKTLADAQFQVFATQADAVAGTNPIAVDGETTFTTNDSGIVVIEGLNVGTTTDSRDYWIKEIKAPAGFILDETPIKVTVTPSGLADAKVVEVANSQVPGGDLPQTGASGTLALIAGALILTAGGVVLLISSRKKGDEEA